MPRFSRISWKSRDDAEPPRIESRIEAAKRRRSERAIPGAPTQTWYCSVSFFAKRRPGGGAFTSGRRPLLALGALQHAHELVVLDVPGGGDDDVAAGVHLPVVRAEDALRHGR